MPRALAGLAATARSRVVLDVPETLPRVRGRRRAARAGGRQPRRQRAARGRRADRPVRVEAGVVPRPRRPARRSTTGPGSRSTERDAVFQPFQRLGDNPRNGTGVGPRPRRRAWLRRGDGRRADGRGHARRRDDDGDPHAPGGRRRVRAASSSSTTSRRSAARSAINLRARGYEVDLAETGEQALELAARHHPDVVVLDLGLPGIGGVEVIEGLRGWSRVPIIVLSVRDAESDKVAALDAGADDYVTKPFGMDELLARLRAALRRATPAEEEAVVTTPDFAIDLAAKRVRERDGRGDPAHADRVAHRRGAGAHRGQARDPAAAAPGGVGPGVRDRDQLPARVHGPGAAQARARSVGARATSSPSRAWATASRSPLIRRARQSSTTSARGRLGSAARPRPRRAGASPCPLVLAVLEERRDQRDDDDHADDRQQVLVDVVGRSLAEEVAEHA